MNTEDVMSGLVPGRRSREELNRANDLLLREHRAYLAAWKEAVTAQQGGKNEADDHESDSQSLFAKDK